MYSERETYELITLFIKSIQEVRIDQILPSERIFELAHQMRKLNIPSLKNKSALQVDLDAEGGLRKLIRDARKDVIVIGEESLEINIKPREGEILALVDMVDGTDLWEMDLPIWCSAAVLFEPDPEEPRIIGSIVCLANGDMYYAVDGGMAHVVYRRADRKETEAKCLGHSRMRELSKARVGFYGQKPKKFFSIAENTLLYEQLKSFPDGTDFRIYNFGGNPAMVKLIDRLRTDEGEIFGGGFDAVIELVGQQLHDMVPGAFIALQGGAYLCELDGTMISPQELSRRLMRPRDRICYVLAATKELAEEICVLVKMK